MRHRKGPHRLTQKPAHARMLKRNLVTSVLLYETVRTTKNRARAIQPLVDRLITVAKTRPAHVAIRSINQVVTDKNASKKIMEIYVKRFESIPSGMTSIVPAGVRKGDGAELVDITLVEGKAVAAPVPKEKTEKTKKTKTKTTKSSKSSDSSKKTTES